MIFIVTNLPVCQGTIARMPAHRPPSKASTHPSPPPLAPTDSSPTHHHLRTAASSSLGACVSIPSKLPCACILSQANHLRAPLTPCTPRRPSRAHTNTHRRVPNRPTTITHHPPPPTPAHPTEVVRALSPPPTPCQVSCRPQRGPPHPRGVAVAWPVTGIREIRRYLAVVGPLVFELCVLGVGGRGGAG